MGFDYTFQFICGLIYDNAIILGLSLSILCLVIGITSRHRKPSSNTKTKSGFYSNTEEYKPPVITPVDPDFEWDQIEPTKSFPFKDAEYKLTMGVRRLDPNEWLLLEPSYLDHIQEKIKISTGTHPKYDKDFDLRKSTIFSTPECEPAIRELYDTVVQFMLDRYPKYFKLEGDLVHNLITDEKLPYKAVNSEDVEQYLLTLCRNVEEDFIILLKDPKHQKEEDEYYFKGGIFTFAAGFDPKDKFNRPMTTIHQPIPGYEEKLKVSMNRFFNRLPVGQFVTRNNFSVQTHDLWFVYDRNKGYNRPKDFVVIPKEEEELDFEKEVFYRSERQVLTRLPKSGAVVFSIRTYLIPMSEMRKEGQEVTNRLAGAIEKLPDDIRQYKNAIEWGKAVSGYLRKS